MIAHLRGKILKITDKGLILEAGPVGYFIYLSNPPLQTEGEEIALYTHHHIKEDHSDLFGFHAYEDLRFFQMLISISGIGPKSAMDILTAPQEEIKNAILQENETFICSLPGIGKKTAKRIIVELKDKIDQASIREYKGLSTPHPDAIDALLKLGYQRKDIEHMLSEMPKEIAKVEEIITYFLKNI